MVDYILNVRILAIMSSQVYLLAEPSRQNQNDVDIAIASDRDISRLCEVGYFCT